MQGQAINAETVKAMTSFRNPLPLKLISCCRQMPSWQLLPHKAPMALAVETQAAYKCPGSYLSQKKKKDLVRGYGMRTHLSPWSPLCLANWLVKKAPLLLLAIAQNGQHAVAWGIPTETTVPVRRCGFKHLA